jgi:hypothetical protein
MNDESNQILRNARADRDAGRIARWQYQDIVKSVMRSEVESCVTIYANGQVYIAPAETIYKPFESVRNV